MKNYLSLISLLFLMLNACTKKGQPEATPSCIDVMIQEFKNNEVQNPPAEVWKWTTENDTYYYIISPCCDQHNYLYDSDCNVVCAPDGGIDGKGEGKCPDLQNLRGSLIWADEREVDSLKKDEQTDRQALKKQFLEIKRLATSISCDNVNEWKYAAYGSKACGGPMGYIAYHQSIKHEILPKIESYTQAENHFNKKHNIISDCMVVMPPEALRCEEGEVKLISQATLE